MKLSDEQLDELEAKANAATPGPWTIKYAESSKNYSVIWSEIFQSEVAFVTTVGPENETCQFISSANPQTVLSLIDEVRKLRKVAEAAKEVGCGDPDCMGYGFIDIEVVLQDAGY